MKVIGDAREFEAAGSVVAIGMFDGVHRGHRRVLRSLRMHGRRLGLPTVVVTFHPHPRAVLRPGGAPALLVSLDDRIDLLNRTGAVDHCVVLPFDRRTSEESAHDFVLQTLVERLHMHCLVVGENFRCGRGRQGDVAFLRVLATALGFTVEPVALRTDCEPTVQPPCSSTEMRRLIECGEIRRAALGLDRPHEMTGTVSQPAGHVIEVTLAAGMCTPAAADYAGAVCNRRAASPWVPAVLEVRHDGAARLASVHLLAGGDVPAACGDVLAMRFLHRVAHSGVHA